jgi:UDP-glucose 4-epimerase
VSLSSLKGQRILITGGLGFIGSNLARKCLELGAQVTVYDCLDPRSGGNMHNVHDIEGSIEIILNDIRNFDGVSACIRNKDVLFSCAAYTSHPNSMLEPLTDIDINCKGIINLLEAARRFNPRLKIVHVASSTQIGKMHINPVDELHPEFPMDIYSANKVVSEKYVLIYHSAFGLATSVVRLANTFGPRANIRNSDLGFINYFIGLALQGKDLTVFGEGEQMRNISYVDDCASALILASQSERSNGEVFFAVSDRQYSIIEIARTITNVIGKSGVKFVEWPKDRQIIEFGDAIISNRKIKETLGWSPEWDLARGLGPTKAYYETCLEKYLR